ncbi:MAG TPA: hypothetical protein PKA05_03775 [Roseiflexaceae bacterium]|nr:hypothetical protein [Roseiflexaceae bacterium]HMP39478.1 hypothetical protein [Roseiflexaceae bacterium]
MEQINREIDRAAGPRHRATIAAIRRSAAWLRRPILATIGLYLFIIALELIKDGARIYGAAIVSFLDVSTTANALGFGWLLAYVFLSGSPVAAISIAFFAAGTIDALQTYTMITGSRLGASFIVLFVGFIYYLRGYQRSASVAIGVLALLTTAAIYLPALALGYLVLSSGWLGTFDISADAPLASFVDWITTPALTVIDWISPPGWALLIIGVLALLAAFSLLDRALPEIDPEQSRFQRIGRLIYRPMAMFILGMIVTSITLSVSVSLSILVPLSVRGLVRRENTLPYIMGANITTFIDTLIAALITGGAAAFMIVLVEMVCVAFFSIIVLLFCYRFFERSILRLQEAILHDRRTLATFLGVMLIVPILLMLVK